MNPLIQPKTITSPLLITLTLLCFGFFPKAQAVVPPPDGGYPGFNTAEGQNALFSLSTATGNVAVGWASLYSDAEGNFNTAIGTGALLFNTADQNTATGAGALLSNTTGFNNTATGFQSLFSNTEGSFNTASGEVALYSNTTGDLNTVTGGEALFSNTTGYQNTGNGASALLRNTTGHDNTANGAFALLRNTTGNDNTAIGDGALLNNTTARSNAALGMNAGAGVTTADNVICIGADVDGENVSNTCYIGNIFGVTSVGIGVLVNSAGKLGTTTSSRRFKDGIKPMKQASEALFALKPVTFHYKKEIDPARTSQFGLVAEEVEKVNPDLIVRDKDGKPYTVRYDAVNAMLLNEFLKEHRTVQELKSNAAKQEATIAHLQKQVAELTAGLQKLTARLELSETATQTALKER
jgi:trimeric autotransporter adhesin